MNTCRHCGQPCTGRFCCYAHQRAWYKRVIGPLVLAGALCTSVAAVAAEDWQARCAAEGGCLMITRQAFEHLVGEIERLQRAIAGIRRGTCI